MNAKRTRIIVLAAATALATIIHAGQASATPPAQTAVSTILSRSTFDELDVWIKWGKLHSIVKTGDNEQSEVVFQHGVLPPGWSGGWHTHPGAAFVTVAEGVLTYYDEHAPCQGKPFAKGDGFVEEAGGEEVHIARNEGSTDLVIYSMYIVTKGDALRTDEPAPPGACFS
jgi:quercetin dioxygenase-like cupin family protein